MNTFNPDDPELISLIESARQDISVVPVLVDWLEERGLTTYEVCNELRMMWNFRKAKNGRKVYEQYPVKYHAVVCEVYVRIGNTMSLTLAQTPAPHPQSPPSQASASSPDASHS